MPDGIYDPADDDEFAWVSERREWLKMRESKNPENKGSCPMPDCWCSYLQDATYGGAITRIANSMCPVHGENGSSLLKNENELLVDKDTESDAIKNTEGK